MGKGVAIIPFESNIYAPCDGIVSVVYKTKHAIGITTSEGVELLIHLGIDTVRLDGKYFESFIKENDSIKQGQKLASFQCAKIKEEGYDITVMLIVTNSSKFNDITFAKTGEKEKGNLLFTLK